MEETKNGFKAAGYVQGPPSNGMTCLILIDKCMPQGVTRIKSGAYTQYVSILIRGTTPPLSVRCGFETIFFALNLRADA